MLGGARGRINARGRARRGGRSSCVPGRAGGLGSGPLFGRDRASMADEQRERTAPKNAAASNLGFTPRAKSYADWYQDLVLKSELADYSPVRGCMVVRPYGWSIWQKIQEIFDGYFRETGHS